MRRRRLHDGLYTVIRGLQVEKFVLLEEDGGLQSVDSISSSRMSDSIEGIEPKSPFILEEHLELEEDLLKATLISKNVMNRYQAHVEKLRRDLKDASLKDHAWELKSWNCVACRKECGEQSVNHSKITIQNLFSNFRSSHLNSVQHIKNWCRKHNVDYFDHLLASKGKTVLLSPKEHKKLIQHGTEIIKLWKLLMLL